MDGVVSYKEFKKLFDNYGKHKFEENDVKILFLKLNSSDSGHLLYNEFLAAMINENSFMDDANLKVLFNIFDLDQDGCIDVEEIKELLLSKDKTLYYKNKKGDKYY